MNKEILSKYAKLKIEANKIDAELDELKPLVLKDILDAEVDKVPTSLGNFTINRKKTWAYSENVKGIEAALKAKKAVEEADGTATFTEMPILVFKENKE